jgi:hypothetical protein
MQQQAVTLSAVELMMIDAIAALKSVGHAERLLAMLLTMTPAMAIEPPTT